MITELRFGVMMPDGKVRRMDTREQAAIYQFKNGGLLVTRCVMVTDWHVDDGEGEPW
jgi:hypothetical protein